MIRWNRMTVSAFALALVATLTPLVTTAASPALAGSDDFANEAEGFAKERGISEAEARRRMAWQLVAPDLDEKLQSDLGTRYAAVWIDIRDGDRVKIGVAGPIDSQVKTIVRNATVAVGLSEFDTVQVRRSMNELSANNTWLADEISRVNTGAAVSLGAGIRTDLNAVQLSIPTTGTLTAAQKELITLAQARFGDGLVFGQTSGVFRTMACAAPYCDKPLRGGVKINHPDTWCTAGFMAQSKVDTKKYVVTAGHCARGNGSGWSSKTTALTTVPIGPVHRWIFDTFIGDMAIIRIDDPSSTGWSPQPWVYVTWGLHTTENTAYHISSDKMSIVGMRICTTGAATRMSNCGRVTELGFTATLDGWLSMRNLGRTSNCGKGGDSGAPMFASHVAYGILVGGIEGECDIVYQGIRTAERELNVNILH
jgi:hypothetical protein